MKARLLKQLLELVKSGRGEAELHPARLAWVKDNLLDLRKALKTGRQIKLPPTPKSLTGRTHVKVDGTGTLTEEEMMRLQSKRIIERVITRGRRRLDREVADSAAFAAELAFKKQRTILIAGHFLMVESVETKQQLIGLKAKARISGMLINTKQRATIYILADGSLGPLNIFSDETVRRPNPKGPRPVPASMAQMKANVSSQLRQQRLEPKTDANAGHELQHHELMQLASSL